MLTTYHEVMKNPVFSKAGLEDDEYKQREVLGNNPWTIADSLIPVTIHRKAILKIRTALLYRSHDCSDLIKN